jgi:hypothetical protein
MISKINRIIKLKLPFLLPIITKIVNAVKYQLSKRRIRRLIKERSEIFIEVGAGDKKGEKGWLTIDITKNCDIFWDLRN